MSTQSGRRTLADIEETLRKARGGLTELDLQFSAASTELARLKQTELGVFAQLAKLRLLAIEQGELLSSLDDADRRVEEILREREAAAEELARQLESTQAELTADETERAAQQDEVAAANAAVDAAEAEAQAQLGADEAYKKQLARTEQTDFVADQAEDKAAAALRDRVEKGKPYERDPLFAYLWSRGFGTSVYRAWPPSQWLDAKVAKLCSYEGARRNYAMLTEIPKRLQEHAAKMRSDFDREAEALRALEQRAAETANVPERQASLDAAEKSLSEIDTSIAANEDRIRTLVEERGRFAAGEDPHYRRCIDVLSEALRQESVEFLRERAARTLAREDDALVGRLAEIQRERDRMEQGLDQFRRLHQAESERLLKFEEVRRRFKERGYDGSHSVFVNGALIGMILNQFLSGSARAGDVWDVLKRQQRHRPGHADPHFGTLRFPRAPRPGPWRMPKGGGFKLGGGFRGGGFKTGGGFRGGGGFKTGGGF